jgi:hypothetical protein
MKKNENEEKDLNITIDPDDIIIEDKTPKSQVSDDSDMPEPETKSYDKAIKLTDKFINLFEEVVGKLPYASILRNANGDTIKLIDLVKYIEVKRNKISIDEMDKIVSFIANIEFKTARPLMELIENSETQKLLWQLTD